MKKLPVLPVVLFCVSNLFAQDERNKTFSTPFVVHSVTYNGSPDPGECWESVAWGILIADENDRNQFFGLYYEDLMELEKKIGDAIVEVEVIFGDGSYDGGNENGSVKKVTLNGEILYPVPLKTQ